MKHKAKYFRGLYVGYNYDWYAVGVGFSLNLSGKYFGINLGPIFLYFSWLNRKGWKHEKD